MQSLDKYEKMKFIQEDILNTQNLPFLNEIQKSIILCGSNIFFM